MVDLNITIEQEALNYDFDFTKALYVNFDFSQASLPPETVSYDFDFNVITNNLFVLRSPSNSFKAVWCDPTASLLNGRFYVAHATDLTIINHTAGVPYIENYFSKTVKGSTGEELLDDNIVDINVML